MYEARPRPDLTLSMKGGVPMPYGVTLFFASFWYYLVSEAGSPA